MKAIITNESKEQIKSCLGCNNEFTEHCNTCDKFSNYDNNPSPLNDLDKISKTQTYIIKDVRAMVLEFETIAEFLPKETANVKQALTNYANMVEMLEGFKNDYQKLLEWVISQLERIDKTAQDEVKYEVRKELYNGVIADITKVLEDKEK
jgi:hypothetical protein